MRWRNLRRCDDMHAVQYLCVFVCLCVCLLVWFARGLCVLPNIYCHNDVWLLREQGFHSREKRGWADNRLGLPLCLCLNAQQIHIHAPNMHTIAHICLESLFIWVAYINESTSPPPPAIVMQTGANGNRKDRFHVKEVDAVSRCRCLVISVVSLGEVKLLQQASY